MFFGGASGCFVSVLPKTVLHQNSYLARLCLFFRSKFVTLGKYLLRDLFDRWTLGFVGSVFFISCPGASRRAFLGGFLAAFRGAVRRSGMFGGAFMLGLSRGRREKRLVRETEKDG